MKEITPFKNPHFCLFIFLLVNSITFSQVGINTVDPTTVLDVNGAISLRTGGDLTLTNGNNNDIVLGATPYSFYRVTGPTAAFSIGSIYPSSAVAADGQILILENNTTQTMTLRHNAGGTNINRILCPGGQNFTLSGQYATVTLMYQTNHNRWVIIDKVDYSNPIDSITLAADFSLGATGSFSDVTGMSLTFVAKKTSVMVMLSGSGDTNTQLAAGIIDFRVVNDPSGTVIGGTHEKLTTFDNAFGVLGAAWSVSFTKPLTGLTIGNSYTIKIQALFDPILSYVGLPPALRIFPVTLSSDHHLTLSVIQ
ncbi:MAG: hypothetical protein R2781_05945 [Flavobacteriaceae bacterium]